MFQPEPTPCASSSFEPYGLATELDFGYSVSAGGGGGGLLYGSQPPPSQLLQQIPRQLSLSSTSSPAASSTFHSSVSTDSSPPSFNDSGALQLQHSQHQQRLQLALRSRQALPSTNPQSYHNQNQNQNQDLRLNTSMEDQGQHDMAAQQAAAKDYRPSLEGPLVGDKKPINVIINEYAKADPIYVEKTAALPYDYSHYRPIQGDGNCGWRAIGFGYFEKLIESGDQAKVEGEVARLMSMNRMLETVGGYMYFDDWVDEMTGLLRDVARNINNPDQAHELVTQRWNDPNVAGGLIYYLRLLAGTYLKSNRTEYEPFVTSMAENIDLFCGQFVEPVDHEIEQIGLNALVNVLLKPVNFVLEIAYLDRSPGSQVNQYRFPETANGQDIDSLGPIIYLLYRPDHYDILYRAPRPASGPTAPLSMQVNRVSSFSHGADIQNTQANLGQFSTCDYGALAMIPSFNQTSTMGGFNAFAPSPASAAPEPFMPMQQNQWMSSFPEELSVPASQTVSVAPIMASPQAATPPTPMSAHSSMGTGPTLLATPSLGPSTTLVPANRTTSGYHIRFSPLQLDYNEGKNNFPEPTFQVTTNTFKNSVWNRAHYGNPDFHPEEWSPDDEHVDGRVGGKKRPRKD